MMGAMSVCRMVHSCAQGDIQHHKSLNQTATAFTENTCKKTKHIEFGGGGVHLNYVCAAHKIQLDREIL